MYCLKCGKDTGSAQIFCDECLQSMEKYPVKPGTPIHLHQREARKAAPRKHVMPLDVQVSHLQHKVRRLRILAILLVALLCFTAALLARAILSTPQPQGRALGQNYTIQTPQE